MYKTPTESHNQLMERAVRGERQTGVNADAAKRETDLQLLRKIELFKIELKALVDSCGSTPEELVTQVPGLKSTNPSTLRNVWKRQVPPGPDRIADIIRIVDAKGRWPRLWDEHKLRRESIALHLAWDEAGRPRQEAVAGSSARDGSGPVVDAIQDASPVDAIGDPDPADAASAGRGETEGAKPLDDAEPSETKTEDAKPAETKDAHESSKTEAEVPANDDHTGCATPATGPSRPSATGPTAHPTPDEPGYPQHPTPPAATDSGGARVADVGAAVSGGDEPTNGEPVEAKPKAPKQKRRARRVLVTSSVASIATSLAVGGIALTRELTGRPVTSVGAVVPVSGRVVCDSGAAVQGVYLLTVTTGHAGSGYALFHRDGANSATFGASMPPGVAISVHAGCGGTPQSWVVDARAPSVRSGSFDVVCDDRAALAARNHYGVCTVTSG